MTSPLAKTFHFSQFENPINDAVNVNFDDIVKYINDRNDGTSSWDELRVTGTSVLGGSALLTTATTGFTYIPGCAGLPTGTPTTYTGRVPIVVDSSNNKFYFYTNGSWRDAGP
jgi:hypothetical protein